MLDLWSKTDPVWLRYALANLDEILLDHAHCEKKAASTALSLIFRYPEYPTLAAPLSRLAREELGHFERMLELLQARNIGFRRQRPSPYAGQLMQMVRDHEPSKALDTLLCCSIIEARSCERMQLLSSALHDDDLKNLYGSLLESEARHHREYVALARSLDVASEADLRTRLRELAEHEAMVLAEGAKHIRACALEGQQPSATEHPEGPLPRLHS